MEQTLTQLKSAKIFSKPILVFDMAWGLFLHGVGAVLMQKQSDHQWKPVAYASRLLTSTEEKYAQIEKEALGMRKIQRIPCGHGI